MRQKTRQPVQFEISVTDLPPDEEPESSSILLGHSKLESTVRYLGIEVDDALEMAQQTEV